MNPNINESSLWPALDKLRQEVAENLECNDITLSVTLYEQDGATIHIAYVHCGVNCGSTLCEGGASVAEAVGKIQLLLRNQGMRAREKRERANQLLREAEELEKLMHHADPAPASAPAQP